MRLKSLIMLFCLCCIHCLALQCQVMSIDSSAPTGLDIALYTQFYNYTLYTGDKPLWGNLKSGGYIDYTISAQAGTYGIQLYYSNGSSSSGSVTALVNGTAQTSLNVPVTDGWGSYRISSSSTITLGAGQSVLRLAAASAFQPYNLAGIVVTPIALTATTTAVVASAAVNPLTGFSFFVNPYSIAAKNQSQMCSNGQLISKIAAQPQSVWFGDWNTDPQTDVAAVMAAAAAKGTTPILTVYNIVNRDCGGYSSGGAASASAYKAWVQALSKGIAAGRAVIVLEPDAVTQYNTTSCLTATQGQERLSLLQYALTAFKENAPNALVYMDAGPPNAIAAALMGPALVKAGISNAAGFAVNTSNYETTADSITYGTAISALTGGKHFVVDTGRNGVGPTSDHAWCNPPNRGLGVPSQTFKSGLVDAYLWVQNPGTSDGSCNGGPAAGSFSNAIACTLLQNAAQ